MAQKRTERKCQSKAAKESGILQLVQSTRLRTAALDTPRAARRLCTIRHAPAPTLAPAHASQQRRQLAAVAHLVPWRHGYLLRRHNPSPSQSRCPRNQRRWQMIWRKNETLTFSGGCWSSLVGVSGRLPSLVLRFFLVPAVAPGLFFC